MVTAHTLAAGVALSLLAQQPRFAHAQGGGTAGGSDSCSIQTIQSSLSDVTQACCVPASVCSTGAPSRCNSQCAHVFLSFYNRCYADLATPQVAMDLGVFDVLAQKCQAVAPHHSCLSNNKQAQVLQYLECARTDATVAGRGVCIQRALSALGLHGQRPANAAGTCLPLALNLPLLADPIDDSSNHRHAVTHGDAYIADGAHFDGSGDYLQVPHFHYSQNGQFSIGMWFTKESCSGGIYEYLFSHALVAENAFSVPHAAGGPQPPSPNPNVHMYIGCEHSGGGWSNLGGTIVRFNVYDDSNTAVMFDYPAWDATSFDNVTNVWINGIMVVDQSTVALYINGHRVDDSVFGFFDGNSNAAIPFECLGNAACDQRTGHPILSHLSSPIGTITMATAIFIGGRMDMNEDRHFSGKIAGLVIADSALTAPQVTCVYSAYNGLLPAIPQCEAMIGEMEIGGNFELQLSLLGPSGMEDQSTHDRLITNFGGDVIVTSKGAHFDGDGDYITIQNFNYESDGDFTISFWITKDDCSGTTTPYEYLYSHVQNVAGAHTAIQDRQNSNVNIYIGCERPGSGSVASSIAGSIVRFNLIDAGTTTQSGSWVLFDYALDNGGDFDPITHAWIHIAMSVTRHAVHAYVDGVKAADSDVGFPTGAACNDMHITPSCAQLHTQGVACTTDMTSLSGGNPLYTGQTLADYCQGTCNTCQGGTTNTPGSGVQTNMIENVAYPYPSNLRTPLEDFDLRSPIYIGARSDLDPQRHFQGHLAVLDIYSSPVTDAEAHCLFRKGDLRLDSAGAASVGHRLLTEMEEEEEKQAVESIEVIVPDEANVLINGEPTARAIDIF